MKNYLNSDEARKFAGDWLPAWTGNRPEHLISFYAEDVFYLDPVVREGIKGKLQLLQYFRKLLARNPDWVWTQREAIPMEGGFLNKWSAQIRKADSWATVEGVCTVALKNNLIVRNEVYFDRSILIMSENG